MIFIFKIKILSANKSTCQAQKLQLKQENTLNASSLSKLCYKYAKSIFKNRRKVWNVKKKKREKNLMDFLTNVEEVKIYEIAFPCLLA